jgi:hypothetical protein
MQMYISLRESGASGFKKWSVSRQPKPMGDNGGDAGVGGVTIPGPSFDASLVTPPALPLVPAEPSL